MDKSLFHLISNAMFDATWGKHYYDELYTPYYADIGHAILIENLSKTPVFQALYAQDTDTEFADAFIANATQGVVSDANVAWAQQHARALLESGASRGEVVTWAVNALHNLSESAPGWGVLKTFYNNREQVSEFFSVQQGLSSQQLAELQSAVAGVNADTASVVETISALRLQYGLEQPNMPVEAELALQDMVPGQLGYEDIAATIDVLDPAISGGDAIRIPESVKDSIVVTNADTGTVFSAGSHSATEINVEAAPDARLKLVITPDNKVFNELPEMAWEPLNFSYVDPVTDEFLPDLRMSPSVISVSQVEEAYIDASNSPDSPFDFDALYPETPVFSVSYESHFVNNLFINTGDANSIVRAPEYSIYMPEANLVADAAYDHELIVHFGSGVNAIAFTAANSETDDHVSSFTVGHTTVYGFSDDDYLYQSSSDSVIIEYEDFLSLVTVENGNTIITLPEKEATITLVGYDSLTPEQFWSTAIIYIL